MAQKTFKNFKVQNKKKLIIFGDGPSAEVVSEIVKEFHLFDILCFTVDRKYKKKNKLNSYKIIEYEKIKKIKNKKDYFCFVSVGYSNMNKNRQNICKKVKDDGFELTNIIHPNSNISRNIKIGENCFIMQDIHIHPFVKIGNNNFIWSGTILSHHAQIGNNCWFTSGSSIAGQTKIGNNCFFGIGSTVTNNLKIGDECFIGAQTLVSKNLKNKDTVIRSSDSIYKLDSEKFLSLINNKF
jgi:sugar O-acyltransferase (sialic acid O-acetyltransferase NeuD family)